MLATQRYAFKEWAVICAALAAGRKSLILRKGGIHEGRTGFQVNHEEFWLFPTNIHQAADDLAEEYLDIWQNLRRNPAEDDAIPIRHYAIVERTLEVTEESALPKLKGLHGWSDRVIQERFRYKQPGLFALLVRVYKLPTELRLANSPHFAGCRSWVDLEKPLSTAELRPVLSDETHMIKMAEIERRLTPDKERLHRQST
jgi:hypothetical protein